MAIQQYTSSINSLSRTIDESKIKIKNLELEKKDLENKLKVFQTKIEKDKRFKDKYEEQISYYN